MTKSDGWIAANVLEAEDEHWEVYLSGPDESPARTDVYVALKPAR